MCVVLGIPHPPPTTTTQSQPVCVFGTLPPLVSLFLPLPLPLLPTLSPPSQPVCLWCSDSVAASLPVQGMPTPQMPSMPRMPTRNMPRTPIWKMPSTPTGMLFLDRLPPHSAPPPSTCALVLLWRCCVSAHAEYADAANAEYAEYADEEYAAYTDMKNAEYADGDTPTNRVLIKKKHAFL